MYSHYFIAKHNLKKHKGEVAILFVLIYLAALLLFSSLSLMLSGNGAIKEADEKIRTFDFPIRPVQSVGFKDKKDGCAFCAYRDVCNLKDEWIKYVHNENEEEEDENDGE